MAVNWDLISIIVFYLLIFLYLYSKRRQIIVQKLGKLPLAFLLRTQHGIKWIRSIGTSYKRFWKYFGYTAIPIGFAGMIFTLGFLIYLLIDIFTSVAPTPSIGLVLPGIRVPGSPVFVPFWYGIIALFIVLIVHEGAHGVVAESWGLKLKSAGVGMFTLLPFAFVEPDEKKLAKAKTRAQLSVFAAGPFANFVTAIIAIFMILFVLAPLSAQVFDVSGLYIDTVDSGLPADSAGLPPGVIITHINGQQIDSSGTFLDHMATVEPGDTVTLKTEDQEYSVVTTEHPEDPSKAYLGINFKANIAIKESVEAKYGRLPILLTYISSLLYWIYMLNLGIGMVNLLPLGPIDGGRMAQQAIRKIFKNKKLAGKLYSLITSLSLALLVLVLVLPYFLNSNL